MVFLLLLSRALLKEIGGICVRTVGVQKPSYSINKTKPLALLHERDDITALATSETFVAV